jgi:hypothetical protein
MADLLVVLSLSVLAIVAVHQALVELLLDGRLPTEIPPWAPGIPAEQIVVHAKLTGEREPMPWPGIDRRGRPAGIITLRTPVRQSGR